MEQSDYNLIMEALDKRLIACENHLAGVKTTSDINNLTIQDANSLRIFCIEEIELMTKIAMVDLYHIIGMGHLSPTQMMKFIYKVQKYLSFRPDIKNIATNLESLTKLPKLPTRTKFHLIALCDLELYTINSDRSGEVVEEDKSDLSDYTDLADITDRAYSKTKILHDSYLDGNRIDLAYSDIARFIDNFSATAKMSSLLEKASMAQTYLGIKWDKYNSKNIRLTGEFVDYSSKCAARKKLIKM